MDTNILELLKKRRSIRKYKNIQIEQVKIDNILKCALLAPSSRRIRPWEFITITNSEVLTSLAEVKEHGASFLHGAPLAIVVISDSEKSDVRIEDTSIAATFIQFSAETLGLGSCWIQIRGRLTKEKQSSEEYVKGLLNIPSKYTVECIITIGYADEEKASYNEDNLPYEKLHTEKF